MIGQRRDSIGFALLLLVALGVTPAAAEEPAGEITRLRGTVQAEAQAGTRDLAAGSAVFVGDEVVTGADTRVEITFRDETVVTLGDSTRFRIDAYAFDAGAETGAGAFSLTTGVFRAITGALTKLRKPSLKVETPVATIAARGTDFWGEQTAELLRMALLDDSELEISNDAGTLVLNEPLQLTVITARDTAPTTPIILTEEQLQAAASTVAF